MPTTYYSTDHTTQGTSLDSNNYYKEITLDVAVGDMIVAYGIADRYTRALGSRSITASGAASISSWTLTTLASPSVNADIEFQAGFATVTGAGSLTVRVVLRSLGAMMVGLWHIPSAEVGGSPGWNQTLLNDTDAMSTAITSPDPTMYLMMGANPTSVSFSGGTLASGGTFDGALSHTTYSTMAARWPFEVGGAKAYGVTGRAAQDFYGAIFRMDLPANQFTKNTPSLVKTLTFAQIKTSATNNLNVVVPAGGIASGNTILVAVGVDNLAAATPTITSIAKPAGDAAAWSTPFQVNAPTATAAASVRFIFMMFTTTADWPAGNYVITLSGAVTAKAVIGWEFANVSGAIRGTGGGTSSTTGALSASIALNTTNTDDLVVGAGAWEAPSAGAAATSTTDGTWSAAASIGTTGGSSVTNVTVMGQYKIITAPGGGVQTWASTGTATDAAGAIIVLTPTATYIPPVSGGAVDIQKIAIGTALVGMSNIYIGDVKVNKVYVGDTLVYEDV